MKYIDEYRQPESVARIIDKINSLVTRPWRIMEVCGGQTHAIMRHGIDQMLPESVTLLHGPGCPVCVTPAEIVDKAIEIALQKNVIFCSFGDMLRVPGSGNDLLSARAAGADVRTVYSPLDSLNIAAENNQKEVVFFAIGFETTAPANAMAVQEAARRRLRNFSILNAQVLIPPAMEAILSAGDSQVQAFLAPGHVCTVTGFGQYDRLVSKYRVPIVITGFEPLDIARGVYMTIAQLEKGEAKLENQYARSVRPEGNPPALRLMEDTFEIVDRNWRGLGVIPNSGLALRKSHRQFDAEERFGHAGAELGKITECISGEILRGLKKPPQCPAFGTRCTPERPLGATMVSSEGACSAYYRYRKLGNQKATGA